MMDHVTASSSGWRNAFLLLSVSDAQSWWPCFGLPIEFQAKRNELAEAALHYCRNVDSTVPDLNAQKGPRVILTETIEMVAKSYGDLLTSDLIIWARRHFIDRDIFNIYWFWALLFRRLAKLDIKTLAVKIPCLSAEDGAKLSNLLERHFGGDIIANDSKIVQAFDEYLRDPVLQQLTAIQTFREGDSFHVDLKNVASEVIFTERAYKLWGDLLTMPGDAIDRLVQCAKQHAKDNEWPEEFFTVPSRADSK